MTTIEPVPGITLGSPIRLGGTLAGSAITPPTGPSPDDGLTGAQIQQWIDQRVAAHRADPLPHPEYDDLPSLTLLFENRLV